MDNAPVVTPKENVGVDILIKMMNELERIVVLRGFFILKKKKTVLEKGTRLWWASV